MVYPIGAVLRFARADANLYRGKAGIREPYGKA